MGVQEHTSSCRARDDDVCSWTPISSPSLYFLSSRFTSSPRSWFVSHRHRCAPTPRMRTAVSAPRPRWDASGQRRAARYHARHHLALAVTDARHINREAVVSDAELLTSANVRGDLCAVDD